jgi:CSLREA domain-containing protein
LRRSFPDRYIAAGSIVLNKTALILCLINGQGEGEILPRPVVEKSKRKDAAVNRNKLQDVIKGLFELAAFVVVLLAMAGIADAATFTINSTRDEVDGRPGDGKCLTVSGTCTLRAAIMEANALGGSSTITIPTGDYVLTITGAGENLSRTGDLDIQVNLTITASGGVATIEGATGWNDRIFDIQSGAAITVTMSGLDIANGNQTASSGDDVFRCYGGAILIRGWPGLAVNLANSTVRDSIASCNGGGIYAAESNVVLNGTTVRGNHMNISSGAVCLGGGGGVFTDSTLTLVRSSVIGNGTTCTGGGLYIDIGAVAQLTDCTIANNSSDVDSGGIRNMGTLTISRCTFNGNTASGGFGGAIGSESGQLTMTNSTISGNKTAFEGGGIDVFDSSATLNNVTIAGNSGSQGGGINFQSSSGSSSLTLNLRNSILAANSASAGADCYFGSGTFTPEYSLIENTNNCIFSSVPTNIFKTDPLLLPLQNNGGPTATRALCTGLGTPAASCTGRSPAIDAANPVTPGTGGSACEKTDQRLVSRPQGSRCDMGAFESSAVGGFEVLPADATVAAGDLVLYSFRWTHTTFWREIQTLQFRIRDGGEPIFWVLWDEQSNTFSLFDPKRGTFGPALPAGSKQDLKSDDATLDMELTRAITSGPQGRDVTLILPLTFKPKAGGKTETDYVIEVAATDQIGNSQGFEEAATLHILRH